MANLTRSAKKSLAILYKEYRQRLESGQRKPQAVYFSEYEDIVSDNREELKAAGYIQTDIIGGISLTDKAIILMENQTIDAIRDLLSFGSQFIP